MDTARRSRNQRSADSLVRELPVLGKKHADKAVRAPEKSSRRTMIPRDCSAKARRFWNRFQPRMGTDLNADLYPRIALIFANENQLAEIRGNSRNWRIHFSSV
jgi:hypothetical protein